MTNDPRLAFLPSAVLPPRPPPSLDRPVATAADDSFRDRARATLLAGAIGDALGRPGERLSRDEVRRRWGRLTEFVPWPGWQDGPKGTVTDDTQLTMVIAETVLAGRGLIDPDDLTQRLLAWRPHARGIGAATSAAVQRLGLGKKWFKAGSASASNGAAMRVAPVGIVHCNNLAQLRTEAVVSAAITHLDPTAVLAAVAQATMVAWCLRNPNADPVSGGLLNELARMLDTMNDPYLLERIHPRTPIEVRLGERLQHMASMLDRDADDIVDEFWNGAYVIESLPVALWAFLKYWDDPEELFIITASMGHDSDTIAAMAGSLAGALHGTDRIPIRWLADLEYRDELTELADSLVVLAEPSAK